MSGDGQTVVACLGDGTYRRYDIRDGREKLAFFPHTDRKRWVTWTTSGYYQTSPGGEDLIGWHINHGREAAADFFPASRLRGKFNRPDVVARALSSPSEAEELRLSNAGSGHRSDAPASSLQTLLPPVGIPAVMVSGKFVVDHGKPTGAHPGKALRAPKS